LKNRANQIIHSAANVILLCFAASVANAQEPQHSPDAEPLRREITALYNQQAQVKSFSQTALSPDGLHIIWSVDGPQSGTQQIYVAKTERPNKAVRVSANPAKQSCTEHDPVWSKDGKQLAFLSDCATPGQIQLFVQHVSADPQRPRQLTHLTGFLSHPQWSPDDRDIALLFVEHASRAPTPMAAEAKAVGVIDDLQNTDVQRLAVTNVNTGGTTQATPAGLYVFEYDWSPDGQQFVYTAAPPPGDDNWYIAKLYSQPCTKPDPVEIYKPRLQIALPRWSPDGKSIAFIQGLMSDQGGTGGDIYTLPSTGGQARNLTPGRPSSPAWFTWLSDHEMLFTEFVGGSTSIGHLDVTHATTKAIWRGDETIRSGPEQTSLSVSQAGGTLNTALIRTSWSMLPEVWTGPPGNWKRVTSVNSSVTLPLPKFDNLTWKNDGFSVQGWLLYPGNYDPAKRYPMLVAVHGGPAWIATPVWRAADFNTTLFTNLGYFVFFPNARGSYGQGERFTKANRRDWGFGDLRDMLAGVDTVVNKYPVDNNRVGILGWSYGGSTAMMAITQTNRFRAAVAGAGAGNWKSYYGQNSIDKWMIPYFGASVYDDPAAYARCSALTYIKKAKTPTLVLVGERDGEAPPAQSIEFWHALKELRVPTRLVIYPEEGHSFVKQEDRIDVTLRTVEWFDRYMSKP
jgi:dipeptidyl aminopeptidase/acylaminoacyl peptidase